MHHQAGRVEKPDIKHSLGSIYLFGYLVEPLPVAGCRITVLSQFGTPVRISMIRYRFRKIRWYDNQNCDNIVVPITILEVGIAKN